MSGGNVTVTKVADLRPEASRIESEANCLRNSPGTYRPNYTLVRVEEFHIFVSGAAAAIWLAAKRSVGYIYSMLHVFNYAHLPTCIEIASIGVAIFRI